MGKAKVSNNNHQKQLQELQRQNAELQAKLNQYTQYLTDSDSISLENLEVGSFFNLALDLLCIADLDGNFVKVNKAWENILGYSARELETRKFLEFVHPDDLPATFEAINQLADQNQVIDFVNRYKSKDGEWRYIEWRSLPYGRYVYAAARDITEWVDYQQKIKASEERFSLVIDASELGIWDWNVVTNVVYYSPQWKKQLGYEDIELKNDFKTWKDLLHPDDYDRMQKEVADFLANPVEHFTAEFRLRHKDGHYLWIHNKASAKKNEGGEVVRFFGAHTDITEQKMAEESVKLAKETYQGVLNSINEAVYIQDEDGKFLDVNKTAEKFYGYPREKFIGQTPEFLSAPGLNNFEEVQTKVNNAFNGVPGQFEFWGVRADGSIFPKEVSVSPGVFFGKRVVLAVSRDISDRKQTEMFLKEKTEQIELQNLQYRKLNEELLLAKDKTEQSEKRYRTLVENNFDGIFLINSRNLSYVNPRFLEITGYSENEIVNKEFDFTNLLNEKSKKIVEDIYQARKEGLTSPVRYEVQLITKTKDVLDVDLSTAMIGGGSEIMIMGIMRDVTQRRKLEREISHRAKLQNLLMNLGARFINVSSEKIDQEIGFALAEMGNFSNTDRVYIFSYDFKKDTMSNTYEWCAENISPEIDNLQDLPNSLVTQWVALHKSGKIVHIPKVDELPLDDNVRHILEVQSVKSLIAMPMMHNGECLGYVGFDAVKGHKQWSESEISMLRLFTELLVNLQVKSSYEKSLKEAKTLAELKQLEVRGIIDNSPVGIALLSYEGFVIDANQAAVRMLGSPSIEAVINKNIYKSKSLTEYGFIESFEECLSTKAMVSKESKFVSIWGKEIFAKYYLVPIIIGNQVKSVLANVEDITSIKDTEKVLIDLKNKAEESDRLKTAFLANMSHEIRTPMNAICGFSNLLLDGNLSKDQKENFVEIININSMQLLSIINDIIDISKIESGQISLSNVKFNVNELLNEVETVFAAQAKLKGLKFTCQKGLSNSEATISSDEMKVRQILNNLIYNALKFTETGSVEIGYKLNGDYLEFFVKDTGNGIPLDKYEVIFERFQQLENTSNQSRKGTGLGLPISKAFVELLGGKIWLLSEFGSGTTFYFSIPYNPIIEKDEVVETSIDQLYIWKNKTILIAEDDDPNYLYLEQLLVPSKAKILWAINGQEAVDMCLKNKVDLVLMDIKMPIQSGFEATKELRQNGINIPIIAQTAYAFSEDKEKALSSGCDHYISKPIEQFELLNLISQYLKG